MLSDGVICMTERAHTEGMNNGMHALEVSETTLFVIFWRQVSEGM